VFGPRRLQLDAEEELLIVENAGMLGGCIVQRNLVLVKLHKSALLPMHPLELVRLGDHLTSCLTCGICPVVDDIEHGSLAFDALPSGLSVDSRD
jgi:hypothetical protein